MSNRPLDSGGHLIEGMRKAVPLGSWGELGVEAA